jgi:hypothetical protein
MVDEPAYSCLDLSLRSLIFLASFHLLLGCNETTPQSSRNPSLAAVSSVETPGLAQPEHYPLLLNRLKQLAGDGAIDCGMVGILEKADAASNCALKAQADKKSFFVRYGVQGIDTEQVLSFAGTVSGNISSVWYFGAGYTAGEQPSSEAKSRKLKFTDDGRISIEECAKPTNFRKANNGRVTCFLRDP